MEFLIFSKVQTLSPNHNISWFKIICLILVRTSNNDLFVRFRHFSHMTKSRIFKNVNLREKADRNFRRTSLKNRFRHLKLYSNPPSWLARCCHMGTFWKTKDWSSYFWEGQPFRFWYVECHRQRRLKSTKTGISS